MENYDNDEYLMKLLYLASGDLWAGAEVQLFHLAKGLARVNDVVLLVVLLNHGQLEQELKNQGVDVVVLDESQLPGFAIFRQLYKLIKQFQPDIVHTHRNKENVIGGMAARLNGKKSIRTVHGASEFAGGILNFKRFIFDFLDKMSALFLQQKIVAVSAELQAELSRDFSPAKLTMIENCVDIHFIEQQASKPCPVLGTQKQNEFHVAFVGRFVPVKRVDLFYAIAEAVIHNKSGKSVHFHMLGDGPLKPGIEAQIRKDNLVNNIHLHGFVSNVAPLLAQMNLLLFTSDHEGLPMTLLEAMTLRVPVLSRQLPSIRNVLCEGECGYFVNSDCVDEAADVIQHIISNANEVKSKLVAARKLIECKYNIDVSVEKYLQLYRGIL